MRRLRHARDRQGRSASATGEFATAAKYSWTSAPTLWAQVAAQPRRLGSKSAGPEAPPAKGLVAAPPVRRAAVRTSPHPWRPSPEGPGAPPPTCRVHPTAPSRRTHAHQLRINCICDGRFGRLLTLHASNPGCFRTVTAAMATTRRTGLLWIGYVFNV
ncbi:DUF6053 domain-containing protein [Lysobacter capsici]|uniref:DUF6053 domain-containing protein n=1 Tax=Lysobacter capsici TaxID=435897 RepID=UPI003CCD0CBD